MPTRPAVARRALTLAEVLIAMGLLAVGLLGVAAVFPVGGYYMQSGDVTDRADAIAQAALNDAIIRGYLDPNRWVVHDGTISGANSARFIELVEGGASRRISTDPARRTGLRRARAVAQTDSAGPADQILSVNVQRGHYTSRRFGGAYVLDPLGITSILETSPSSVVTGTGLSFVVRRFPASIPDSDDQWADWFTGIYGWPVRRATPIHDADELNGAYYGLQRAIAEELFTASDDLALTLPTSGDQPARQLWETSVISGDAAPSARQSAKDFSWLLTVAPAESSQRDTAAAAPDAYPMEVSAVVFHKRAAVRGVEATLQSERLVKARVVSTGPGGGELLLEKRTAEKTYGPLADLSPFEDLREGQYVMVVGPHPLSGVNGPMLVLRWYRVVSIEDEGRPALGGSGQVQLGVTGAGATQSDRVLVGLRGPDWPWQPAADLELGTVPPTNRANDLRVAIVPGAVAVHTKTMRLETGSEWSID